MNRQVFTLPDLGEGLDDAQLVRWLVAVGDPVAVDAPVAEVETAKAMVEVPCPYAGVVAALHGAEGEVIAVGAPLVSVDPVEDERAASGHVLIGYGTSGAGAAGPPRRRARREVPVVDPATPAPTEPAIGRGTSEHTDARPAAQDSPDPAVAVASPLVRTLARTSGVDLRQVHGTGPAGLITRSDVERSAAEEDGSDVKETTAGPIDRRTGLAVGRRVPLTGVRKAIAQHLSRSRQEIPEATTWVDVDATALLELRATLAGDNRPGPGVLALVARFVVAGLTRFPELNSRVDVEAGEIVQLDGVNLGIATQTDRGLVVPVVRGAHTLGTRALGDEIRRLTTQARSGPATGTELTGGSFTLNNYGMLGVDGSVAIINHPEVAILGIGRIIPRPWVVDGAVVVRSIAQLSLVFDHRVCDGGTAGGFLRYVADAVESPTAALVDLAEL